MGGGLNLLRGGKFASITKRNGLFDVTVWQVMEDSTGRLWMSSNKGIFSASKKEIHDFADGKIRTIACVSYGTVDGMKSSECNGGFQPAGCRSSRILLANASRV